MTAVTEQGYRAPTMGRMDIDGRFTDDRMPDSQIRFLMSKEHRWQRWLDVEAALAIAEAQAGIIPREAAAAIAEAATVEQLGPDAIRKGVEQTGHKLMAIVSALSHKVGEPHGGWVHWGATTQNITQTGDMLILREAHTVFLDLLGQAFEAMAPLAEKGQNMLCAGRTHGQHAVPITFGFKVAGWIDEFDRHIDRLHEVEPRVFSAMLGGAVGNFASLGSKGPLVQQKLAAQLRLQPMKVPLRCSHDAQAEYVCVLGLVAGTAGKIAKEISQLMQTEFGEVCEPIPLGTIGSSTMPHKRNPQLTDDCIVLAAELRSLVPFALEGMLHDHEVNEANAQTIDIATRRACVYMGDLLTRLVFILKGLVLDPARMRANLDLTGGLISSEAIMLTLGESIGRQAAHEVIYEAAQAVIRSGQSFQDALRADPRVTNHLSAHAIAHILDPGTHIGLSAAIAKKSSRRAHTLARQLRHRQGILVACRAE